MNMLATSNDRK